MKTLAIVTLALSLAAPMKAQTPAAAPAGAAADMIGTWNATFTTQNGQIPAQIKLTKTGAKVTGTISSQMGESSLEAEQKDKAVSMWFTMAGQSGPIPIELNGTIDGDTLKGSALAAGSPAGEFIATRAKADAPATAEKPDPAVAAAKPAAATSLTGTWSVSVELPNMTATPTVVLKQDGEKLTGEYVSGQYGKFPIAGTVKGADVTFSFSMNIEGNGLNVTYAGKVDKDNNLAGSVTYGDMMSGTFSATLKK
jgi:hypothetical protein